MIRRTTWVVLAVFGLLVALAWYLQRDQGEPDEQATATPGLGNLFTADQASINRLTVADEQGRNLEVFRDGTGEWTIGEAVTGTVDSARIETAIGQLAAIPVLSMLDPVPALDVIGLDTPAYTIAVTVEGGLQQVAQIGDVTPIGSGYYARLESGEPLIVGKFAIDSLVGLLDDPPVLPPPSLSPDALQPEETEGVLSTPTLVP